MSYQVKPAGRAFPAVGNVPFDPYAFPRRLARRVWRSNIFSADLLPCAVPPAAYSSFSFVSTTSFLSICGGSDLSHLAAFSSAVGSTSGRTIAEADEQGVGEVPDALRHLRVLLLPVVGASRRGRRCGMRPGRRPTSRRGRRGRIRLSGIASGFFTTPCLATRRRSRACAGRAPTRPRCRACRAGPTDSASSGRPSDTSRCCCRRYQA